MLNAPESRPKAKQASIRVFIGHSLFTFLICSQQHQLLPGKAAFTARPPAFPAEGQLHEQSLKKSRPHTAWDQPFAEHSTPESRQIARTSVEDPHPQSAP